MKKNNLKYLIIGIAGAVIIAIILIAIFCAKNNTVADPKETSSQKAGPEGVESGEITVTYNDDGFVIETLHSEPKEVKFSQIGGTTYREFFITGDMIDGFSSSKLEVGTFKNEELGKYSRYAYTGEEKGFVVVELIDGAQILEYIVLNGDSIEATNAIFNEITDRVVA